ncbi:hypothetical protein KJ682_06000, partial [bacterium]|nr:hypothetical protein [bacterium]
MESNMKCAHPTHLIFMVVITLGSLALTPPASTATLTGGPHYAGSGDIPGGVGTSRQNIFVASEAIDMGSAPHVELDGKFLGNMSADAPSKAIGATSE